MRKPPHARAARAQTGADALVARGKQGLALEAAAVQRIADRLGPPFGRAVELLKAVKGRVIVSGVGKSGLIARKIAATLTLTAPGLDKAVALDLLEKAHQVCPYSKATRGNVDVKLAVA